MDRTPLPLAMLFVAFPVFKCNTGYQRRKADFSVTIVSDSVGKGHVNPTLTNALIETHLAN